MNFIRNNYDVETRKKFFRKAVLVYHFDLITDYACIFLSDTNKCIIHSVAPIDCKRWGLQSKTQSDEDWANTFQQNEILKKYYSTVGITIDNDESMRLAWCDKVKVLKNPYNFLENDFERMLSPGGELYKIASFFSEKNAPNWNLSCYMAFIVMGKNAIQERIQNIRNYQHGDKDAIDNYINSLSFENII